MSKHHHQSKEEQINNKAHGVVTFHHEKKPYEASESMRSAYIQNKVVVDDRSIRLLAYEIYREKGGTSFDNWIEAERILRIKY